MKIQLKGLVFLALVLGCQTTDQNQSAEQSPTRKITKYDDRLDLIIDVKQQIQLLAEGFDWTEGPLWLPSENKVIFSDIPKNTIYEWSEKGGKKVYLKPSGFTGSYARGGESGSNALLLDPDGRLVLCQHGDRRMARMDAPLNNPEAKYTTLASHFEEKRLNSPNDAVYDRDGYLYFTDPPYGLENRMNDSTKELTFQGVYRRSPSGKVDLMIPGLSRPNGIAFSPDYSKIYVANSDAQNAIWMVYDVNISKQFINGRIFSDATDQVENSKGLPDGLKVNQQGIVFATGPGGVFIFDPAGDLLGKIETGEATSNCAFGPNEQSLYITADFYLMRVDLL